MLVEDQVLPVLLEPAGDFDLAGQVHHSVEQVVGHASYRATASAGRRVKEHPSGHRWRSVTGARAFSQRTLSVVRFLDVARLDSSTANAG